MKVSLLCSDNMRPIIEELLKNRQIYIDPTSNYAIVEKGLELPENKLVILYDVHELNLLMSFLDSFDVQKQTPLVITGKIDDRYEIIDFKEVVYFEALGNDVYCCANSIKFKLKEKLYTLEHSLADKGFIRISKSYIVNIMMIDNISPWFNGKLILKLTDQSEELEVSRKYIKAFKSYLGL